MRIATPTVTLCVVLLTTAGCHQDSSGGSGQATPAPATNPSASAPTTAELERTRQVAVDAAVWGMPAVSMAGVRKSLAGIGADYNQVVYFSAPLEARHEFLTANNQTPYVLTVIDTHNGPVVMDVPPATDKVALFGSAIDSWEVPLIDVGPSGDDAGKGGKYLFLPPGYQGAVPANYIAIPSPTYYVHVALRPIISKQGTLDDAVAYSKTLKVYPLDQAANPKTHYVDAFPQAWKTLPVYDATFFKDLAMVINEEPAQERDAAMLEKLATIGIERGKSFEPAGDIERAFDRAAHDAYVRMQNYFETEGKGQTKRWADRQWSSGNIALTPGFTFVKDGELLIDSRANTFFFATWLPKKLGTATAYITGLRDSTGNLLSGDKTYRLHVPADVPARDFWSVIVYSMKTKSMIKNAQNRVGLSSYDKQKMQMNSDGSVDIYFGPNAPAGKEANWLPTGEDFFLLFRFYGPENAYLDKSWKLPDIDEAR